MNAPRFIDTNILLYSISRDSAEARKRDAPLILDADDLACRPRAPSGPIHFPTADSEVKPPAIPE